MSSVCRSEPCSSRLTPIHFFLGILAHDAEYTPAPSHGPDGLYCPETDTRIEPPNPIQVVFPVVVRKRRK